ncbi:hypothetical protein QUB60_01495 [Microcoleus sp. A2-C5]|uniref:hypothetical protein n=1 Tax=unclassified Microcoleus TaxID=2642155 RepID=UPI002FD27854
MNGFLRDRTDSAIRGGFSLGCACVFLGYGKRAIDLKKLRAIILRIASAIVFHIWENKNVTFRLSGYK